MTGSIGSTAAGSPSVARDRDAWTQFWADGAQSRCAAGAPDIWRSLSGHWREFARALPRGAHVLDLGCGAGAVGRLLLDARGDLQVTGIDAARVPASASPRLRLRSRIDMEALPFEAGSFAAVVSQFGFEYSQAERTAREVARVLAPGARLSFLLHHSDSAIVRTNRERLGAVVAFLGPAVRDSFRAGDAAGFGCQIALLVERYPDDALVRDLARALPARLGGLAEKRASTWESLEDALAPEQSMSRSLEQCCVSPDRIDGWLEPLRAHCDIRPVGVLRESDGTPIAWRIDGASRAG